MATDEVERGAQRPLDAKNIVFFVLCAVVTLDAIGYIAAGGPQNIFWLVVFAISFGVPFALVTAELGSAFPGDGGIYQWIRTAFGRTVAGIATFFYWVSAPVWIGGVLSVVAMAVVDEFITPLSALGRWGVGLAFVATAVAGASVPLSNGTVVTAIGALTRVLVVGAFVIAVVFYGMRHGVHLPAVTDMTPSLAGLLAAIPVFYFVFYGFEAPNAAGGDMVNPRRDVPRSTVAGLVAVIIMYAAPVIGVLLVVPTDQVTSLTGFIDAMKTVFTVFGGHVLADGSVVLTGAGQVLASLVACGFIVSILTAAAAWLVASNRVLAAAAADGAAAASLSRFSPRTGSPSVSTWLAAAMALTTLICAQTVAHGDLGRYFSAGIALTISTTAIGYLVMFPAYIKLRYTKTVVWPFTMPGGHRAGLCGAVIVTGWTVAALTLLVWPGFAAGMAGETPDSYLPAGFEGQRFSYTAIQVVALTVLGVAAVVVTLLGRRNTTAKQKDAVRAR
jgi:glutamate:GABA antiporter